jgi:hypothetical protein
MDTKKVQSGPRRLPYGVVLSGTDEKAKAELTRILTMCSGEPVLCDNLRKGNVKIVDHLIRLVRRDPQLARKTAACLLGIYGGTDAPDTADRVASCLREMTVECRENVLEGRYMAGLADSREKADLVDAITDHVVALEALRDLVIADLYAPVTSRMQQHAGASL